MGSRLVRLMVKMRRFYLSGEFSAAYVTAIQGGKERQAAISSEIINWIQKAL